MEFGKEEGRVLEITILPSDGFYIDIRKLYTCGLGFPLILFRDDLFSGHSVGKDKINQEAKVIIRMNLWDNICKGQTV